MISQQLNNQIHFYLTSLLAFFIPIHSKIPPILIVLLAVNWLINPKNIRVSFNNIKNNYALGTLILFFLFYVVGVVLSDNIKFGLKVLETNLSLIILPLIFAAYINKSNENIKKYLKFYVIGCVIYVLMCLGYASYAYFKPVYVDLYENGTQYYMGGNYFFYSYLSLFFHPSYTAMHSVFALLIIFIANIKHVIKFNFLIAFFVTLLTVFILLLSSKAGWLGLISLVILVFYHFISQRKIIRIFYFLIPLIGVFLLLNVYYTPDFSNRLPETEKIMTAIKGKDQNNKEVNTFKQDGNASRIFIWKASFELFSENLFGLGTGDAKDKLLKRYKVKGMTTEYKSQLNCHNQYLSTSLSIGGGGLILLLFILLYPFVESIKSNQIILAGFIFLVALNFLFESMLETQKGIAFFSFFYVLLCSVYLKKKIL